VWFALGSWRIRLRSRFEEQGYLSEPSCPNSWFSVLSEVLQSHTRISHNDLARAMINAATASSLRISRRLTNLSSKVPEQVPISSELPRCPQSHFGLSLSHNGKFRLKANESIVCQHRGHRLSTWTSPGKVI